MSDSTIQTSLVSAPTGPIETNVSDKQAKVADVEAEIPKVEETKPEEPKLQDKFAPKFAALSRKEKEVRQQEAAIKAERAEMEKMRAEIAAQKAEIEKERGSWKAKLKENPFEVLQEEGLTYDELTEMALNDKNPTVEMQMKRMRAEMEKGFQEKLSSVEAKLAEKEAKELEAAKKLEEDKYNTIVSQYKEQLKNVVDADDSLELVKTHNAYDLVFDVVEQYFQETGEVLQPLDAAKHVESELELEAQKILKAKKFNKPKVEAEAPEQKQPNNKATLTNSNASEMPVNGTKLLPRDESIRELAKTIRWIK